MASFNLVVSEKQLLPAYLRKICWGTIPSIPDEMVTLVRHVAMKKMLRIGASIPEWSNISDQ